MSLKITVAQSYLTQEVNETLDVLAILFQTHMTTNKELLN